MKTLPHPSPHAAGRRRTLATAAAALLAAALPFARADGDLSAALVRFEQAQQGQSDAIDDAATRLAALSNASPTDPLLLAYAGAATALRARTTMLPWRKITFAEDGLALIDKALALLSAAHDAPGRRGVPTSLETRFIAASTFLNLPGFFNREERGRKLLDGVLSSPLFEASPIGFRAAVWMRSGQLAQQEQRVADARRWYQRAADSGAPQAGAARNALQGL